MKIENFSKELAQAIALYLTNSLDYFSNYEMQGFDVGCFPWNGYFELSFRTSLDDPASKHDIADWKFYAFNHELLNSSLKLEELGRAMQSVYSQSSNPPELAHEIIQATAIAVSSGIVRDSLSQYNLASGFEVTVFHPDLDNSNNFCLPHS